MGRRKMIKLISFISIASLFLSGMMDLSTHAEEETVVSTEVGTDWEEEETKGDGSIAGGEKEDPIVKDNTGSVDAMGKNESPDSTTEEDNDSDSVTEKDSGSDSVTEENTRVAGSEEQENVGDEIEGDTGILVDTPDMEKTENVPVRLQVPQKFDIMLDPWEMDEKGQIYSEEYMIKNISGEKGTLRLTGIAKGAGEDVDIWSDSQGIHNGNGQDIFIEMMINEEDRIALLPEGTDYETTLEADESVTLTFTGRMNENAGKGWHASDVEVTVIYDWVSESEGNIAEEDIISEEESIPEEEKDSGENETEGYERSDEEEGAGNSDSNTEEGKKVVDTDGTLKENENEEGKTPVTDTLKGDSDEGKISVTDTSTDGSNVGKTPDTDISTNDGNGEIYGTDLSGDNDIEGQKESSTEEMSIEEEDGNR